MEAGCSAPEIPGLPWEYDRELYLRPDEIKRLFRRLQDFGGIFCLFEKLNGFFLESILFAPVFGGLGWRGLVLVP